MFLICFGGFLVICGLICFWIQRAVMTRWQTVNAKVVSVVHDGKKTSVFLDCTDSSGSVMEERMIYRSGLSEGTCLILKVHPENSKRFYMADTLESLWRAGRALFTCAIVLIVIGGIWVFGLI